MNAIIVPVLVLGIIALIASVVLYACSKKFAVEEDPRLPAVLEVLPGANCGGCGFPGCAGLAGALVKAADAGSIDGLECPVGGEDVMSKVVDILSMAADNPKPEAAKAAEPKAAAAGGAPKAVKAAPAEKPFVPTAIPTNKPCEKPAPCPDGNAVCNTPAGCRPADMNTLKSVN